MTEHQKVRRLVLEAELGKADPKAVEVGVRILLSTLLGKRLSVTIRSDDHRAYPRAMASLGQRTAHQITSSTQRRDVANPLWEINVLDLMIRHSTAAHKRETIAWAKRRQASIEKLSIFQVWRNYVKRRREKGRRVTPAMLLGVANRPWQIRDLLSGRLFFEKTELSERWQAYYRRHIETRALRVNRTHELTYGF
jgi:hypothetical protein